MNVVFLSPHFPPQYYRFCQALKKSGANVLGIADTPYNDLSEVLKSSLTEYYRVNNLEEYDNLYRAIAYFIHKYGRIDRLDSLNEYWLGTEARLRTDFNITGIKSDGIDDIKLKSKMKKRFQNACVDVARGATVENMDEARKFIKKTGFPVVAKPDDGVGAASTYKVDSMEELEKVFRENPGVNYFIEEFVLGDIYSFDGLTDKNGTPVFYTSHVYSSGVMEVVTEQNHLYYYSLREIPGDLEDAGMRTLKSFDVRERFFHIEYFRAHKDNRIVGLEVNMRPPGGFTTDMFNYANDIDIYQEWANVILRNEFRSCYSRKYHCSFIGRRRNKNYKNSHDTIVNTLGDHLVMKGEMPPIFAKVMGEYYYIARSQDLDKIKEINDFVLATA